MFEKMQTPKGSNFPTLKKQLSSIGGSRENSRENSFSRDNSLDKTVFQKELASKKNIFGRW